jgi:apolipoprotein N-acyltransferase
MLRYARTIALGAGLLSATGFAPLEWWPVTLATLALLLALTHQAPTLKSALLRGWLFGLGHFTIGNNWIQHAFTYQDEMPHGLGYLAPLLLAVYLAVYPAFAAGLAWRFGRARGKPDAGFVLVAAAAWIVTEWLRAGMFTGYAWNPLGVLWVAVPGVAQLAAWIGTYALSGLTMLAAGALLLGFQRHWRFPAAIAAGFGIAAFALLPAPAPSDPARRVQVVQPNIGQEHSREQGFDEMYVRALEAGSGKPGRVPRLLVWPEGAVNYFVEGGYPQSWYWKADPAVTRARLAALLGPDDQLLFGGNALVFGRDGKSLEAATNSVYAIDAFARLRGRYDKAHLVPYGEYLPMRPLLSRIGLSRLVQGDVDFRPGPAAATLPVAGFGSVGMQICYEIVFSGEVVDAANRPGLIFNPSNDAWFGTWGPPQHLAQARMRAIEEGVPILRATPNGISAVIDARGTIVASVGRHVAGIAEAPLPLALPPTLFARIGNAMAFFAALLFVALAIAIRRVAR